jgi:hypothetical protein
LRVAQFLAILWHARAFTTWAVDIAGLHSVGIPSLHITVRPKLAAHPRRNALPRIRVEPTRASLWAAGAVARSVADSSADG